MSQLDTTTLDRDKIIRIWSRLEAQIGFLEFAIKMERDFPGESWTAIKCRSETDRHLADIRETSRDIELEIDGVWK